MSQLPLGHSPDLRRLREDGYEVSIDDDGRLVVDNIACVTTEGKVGSGSLVCELNLSGDRTGPPGNHEVDFVGPTPCNRYGKQLPHITRSENMKLRGQTLQSHHFSSRPSTPFPDYHAKITNYANMINGPAQAIGGPSARTYREIADDDPDSVFKYLDTGPGRSGVSAITRKVEGMRVAIVGLGGTGSYILDFVAKTPVREIHLFDGDILYSHNAFRSPGAAKLETLREAPKKVDYYRDMYGPMREGIVPHPYPINETNLGELDSYSFAFLSMDSGPAKEAIVRFLTDRNIPFIDTGIGVYETDDRLAGVLRVTTSTLERQDHVLNGTRIDFTDRDQEALYDRNIQIAELNAFSASLAVIRWKKWAGIYLDLEHEHCSAYTIDGNALINVDRPRCE
ncbi:ThiF family adenylyltransferase [Ferrimicrobium sp.]|uniref:ThiF family adenylyltransferase n=1 Tax=Ferrimicrobium sp. TaxID=2926050 RepID=UPI0026317791|nr:ThiF family adenylyltransferase [Ferrimicrobium sp.]